MFKFTFATLTLWLMLLTIDVRFTIAQLPVLV